MKQNRFLLCCTLATALLFSSGCADKEDSGTKKSNSTWTGMTTITTTILPGEIGTDGRWCNRHIEWCLSLII